MSLPDRLHSALFPALLTVPALAGVSSLVFLYAGLPGGLNMEAVPLVALAATVGGAASLCFLPGILCGRARDMRLYAMSIAFLYVAVGLNLLAYQKELWFQALAFVCVIDFLAVVALFYDQRQQFEQNVRFRSMILCALALAAIFGLMAYELLAEPLAGHPPVSDRIMVTGYGALGMVCITLACTFYGPRFPRLFWLLMCLSLFYIWLAVPAVGLEAYLPMSGQAPAATVTLVERFHHSAWKWLLGLCGAGLAFSVRLLILWLDIKREGLLP